MHLEEVRFFDLFGYSEEAGTWQCFMCNNPEKATGECSASRGWAAAGGGVRRGSALCRSGDGGRGCAKSTAKCPA